MVLAESEPSLAAQSFPVLKNITRILGENTIKIVLEEEHFDLINSLLSEDIDAMPKLIAIDKTSGAIRGIWGPCMKTIAQLYNTVSSPSSKTVAA